MLWSIWTSFSQINIEWNCRKITHSIRFLFFIHFHLPSLFHQLRSAVSLLLLYNQRGFISTDSFKEMIHFCHVIQTHHTSWAFKIILKSYNIMVIKRKSTDYFTNVNMITHMFISKSLMILIYDLVLYWSLALQSLEIIFLFVCLILRFQFRLNKIIRMKKKYWIFNNRWNIQNCAFQIWNKKSFEMASPILCRSIFFLFRLFYSVFLFLISQWCES